MCCMIVITLITAEQSIKESFTVPARPKKESNNQIKEDIGRYLLDNAKKNAHVIKISAHLEELLLEDGDALITQKKNSVLDTNDSEKLKAFRSMQEELNCTLDSYQRSIQQTINKRKNIPCLPAKK